MNEPKAVPLDLDTADRLAHGELYSVWYGQRRIYRLGRADWPLYEAAKQTGYIIMPRVDHRYYRLNYVWWRWCEPRGWPVVMIKPRVKYALIEADQIALSQEQRDALREKLAPIEHLFAEHLRGGWYSVDPTYTCISRAPLSVAPLIASRIVAVLWEALELPALPKVEATG